ncbi:hypothetical protein A9K55_004293 [Cordyceps militaris]|uniref:Uncharacterized protein n=1 Tax=Cordyceps militaris TaxID=73501 RepID=A0A2H4SN98_CORMI|nr:hypothetical protein A9K55_004293 [Cordyceps militaris]
MKPVQQSQSPKIHIKALMVPVMLPSQAVEEVVAAVHRRRLDELAGEEQPEGEDMGAQQQRGQDNRQGVGDEVLERVGVLRRERDGRREAVVRLVHAPVQRPPVQQPVRVVEERLPRERAHDEVARHLGGRRQRGRHAECRGLAGGRGQRGARDLQREDRRLVPERDAGRVEDVGPCRLLRRRLHLVRGGEGRGGGVEQDVEERGQPPEEQLDDLAADNVDDVRVVGRHGPFPDVHGERVRSGVLGRSINGETSDEGDPVHDYAIYTRTEEFMVALATVSTVEMAGCLKSKVGPPVR